MSSLQVFVEPVEHASKSLFSAFDSGWVGGIISASKSMGNSWQYLDKVWNLQMPSSCIFVIHKQISAYI
jgi:hypothetical protein